MFVTSLIALSALAQSPAPTDEIKLGPAESVGKLKLQVPEGWTLDKQFPQAVMVFLPGRKWVPEELKEVGTGHLAVGQPMDLPQGVNIEEVLKSNMSSYTIVNKGTVDPMVTKKVGSMTFTYQMYQLKSPSGAGVNGVFGAAYTKDKVASFQMNEADLEFFKKHKKALAAVIESIRF